MIVPLGLLQTILGYRLQKLPSELGGVLKPYCWLNMATGLFLASIILIPLGILTGAVTDIMLGTILFQEAAKGNIIDTEA
jgi:hypothetical protein